MVARWETTRPFARRGQQRRGSDHKLQMMEAGTKLGRYEIRAKTGAGGMGEVYLAQDTTELERTVAIKVLPAEVAADPKRMQRFVREAKTVSALNHPNILTIYEF